MEESTIGTTVEPIGSSGAEDQAPQHRKIDEREMGCGPLFPIRDAELEKEQLAPLKEGETRTVQAVPKPAEEGLFPPSTDGGELSSEEEDMAPDLASDPLVEEEPVSLNGCTYEFFSGLKVRRSEAPDADGIRARLREVLGRAPGPKDGSQLSGEEKANLDDWLQNVREQTHDPEQFVAGSFNRHLPAWEELLKDSSRESSQKVLKILRAGVKPQFVGTRETEPKKLEQVRPCSGGSLRLAV
jgi:hypothetical protein